MLLLRLRRNILDAHNKLFVYWLLLQVLFGWKNVVLNHGDAVRFCFLSIFLVLQLLRLLLLLESLLLIFVAGPLLEMIKLLPQLVHRHFVLVIRKVVLDIVLLIVVVLVMLKLAVPLVVLLGVLLAWKVLDHAVLVLLVVASVLVVAHGVEVVAVGVVGASILEHIEAVVVILTLQLFYLLSGKLGASSRLVLHCFRGGGGTQTRLGSIFVLLHQDVSEC